MAPNNRAPQISAVAGCFLALTTITIIARSYCRAFIIRSFGADDWAALAAWIFFSIFCAFVITGTYHGNGQHSADLAPGVIPVGLKFWWLCEIFYVVSNMAIKLSIAIMLLRISIFKIHKVVILVALGVCEIYSGFFFFLFILQCRPSAYFWTRYTGGSGTCVDPRLTVNATYGYSAVSCAVDWTLAIVPFFLVWNLQMNGRTKVSVAFILAMGAIASMATIVRFPYVHTLSNTGDFLYATADIAIWSTVETGLGITACCVATLRPLFRKLLDRTAYAVGTGDRPATNIGWGNGNNGYIRSGSDHIGLRSDLGKGSGVTTVIGVDEARVGRVADNKRSRGDNRWPGGKSDVGDGSSEEDLNMGIRTTVETRISER